MQAWDSRRYWEVCHQHLWLCPYYLEHAFRGVVRPASDPCFLPTATSHLYRCGWCDCYTAEMFQAARMLGRDVPAELTAVLTYCRITEGGLKDECLSAYESTQNGHLYKHRLILLLNILINHLLSGNIKPTDFKCHYQVPGIHERQTK